MKYWNAVMACVAGLAGSTVAAEPAPDKSRYHLFNPTPAELMRDMDTDRPDKTESPYSVDAGHFQIEMDFVTRSYDRYNAAGTDTRVKSLSIAPVNLKVGLCNRADFQLVLQTYNRVRTDDRATGTVTTQQGFGDVIPRLKVNLWGNDGGRTAMALMPYIKLPTNQDGLGNQSVEYGLIVPLSIDLAWGWNTCVMTQLDVVRDSATSGYHPEFVNSITFNHDIVGKLSGFVEFYSSVSTEPGSTWIGTVDLGLGYSFTKNLKLDAGVYLGITRAADDVAPFVGISWRF
jgi:hypothetical protein